MYLFVKVVDIFIRSNQKFYLKKITNRKKKYLSFTDLFLKNIFIS